MNKNLSDIPVLGVGLGFRTHFKADLFRNPASVDFLEITADHFMFADRQKIRELELLREQFTLIPHGLDLSLGSACGIDDSYAREFAKLINKIQPPYWSEHIAFTRHENINIGHLSPVVFSRESLDVFRKNIEKMRQLTDCPLVLENITVPFYFPQSEMSESDFLHHLLNENDCGLLLDLTNVYTNAHNHKFDATAFIRSLPTDRVIQLHLAGGYVQAGGIMIDSHSDTVSEAVLNLLRDLLHFCRPKAVIIERDEKIPPFESLRNEIAIVKNIMKGA